MSDEFTRRSLGYWGRRARDPKLDAFAGPVVVLLGAMCLMTLVAGMNRER